MSQTLGLPPIMPRRRASTLSYEETLLMNEKFKQKAHQKKVTQEELIWYMQIFQMFDTDESGSIDKSELKSVMLQIDKNAKDIEIDRMVDHVDFDKSGKIDFDEFLLIIGPLKQAIQAKYQNSDNLNMDLDITSDSDEALMESFKVMDVGSKGYITAHDLSIAYGNLGKECDMGNLETMIMDIDSTGKGQVCYADFATMMKHKA